MPRFLLSLLLSIVFFEATSQPTPPLKVAVIGLTHTHVHWIFNSEQRGEIEIIGIVEPNKELAKRYTDQYGFSSELVFDSNKALMASTRPEAVTAFGTIYDHLSIVEFFAPLGIHIMVEKPLAVSLDHAIKMQALAQKHQVELLTNYETTWYPTNHKAYELLRSDSVGAVKKVIVRDGHKGPKKIGVDEEFLEWLTDPELNGAGALMDFGCYGANLLTWMMQGERPLSVTAVTHQLQAENNPEVDDVAIITLKYKDALAILQPSWNWPIGRKDMEIHGQTGVIFADNRNDMRVRMAQGYDDFDEYRATLPELKAPFDDPFAYLAAVVQERIDPEEYALSSLENNMIVMEILQAAKESAASGRTVTLDPQ